MGKRAVYMHIDKMLVCLETKQKKEHPKICPLDCKCLRVEEGNYITEAMFDKGVKRNTQTTYLN